MRKTPTVVLLAVAACFAFALAQDAGAGPTPIPLSAVPHAQGYEHTGAVADLRSELRRPVIVLSRVLDGFRAFLSSEPRPTSTEAAAMVTTIATALHEQHVAQNDAEKRDVERCNARLSSFMSDALKLTGDVRAEELASRSANAQILRVVNRMIAIEEELNPLLHRSTRLSGALERVSRRIERRRSALAHIRGRSTRVLDSLRGAAIRHATQDSHFARVNAAADDASKIRAVHGPDTARLLDGLEFTLESRHSYHHRRRHAGAAAGETSVQIPLNRHRRHHGRRGVDAHADAGSSLPHHPTMHKPKWWKSASKERKRMWRKKHAARIARVKRARRAAAAARRARAANGGAALPTDSELNFDAAHDNADRRAKLAEELTAEEEARARLAAAIGPEFVAEFGLAFTELSAEMAADEEPIVLPHPFMADPSNTTAADAPAPVVTPGPSSLSGVLGSVTDQLTSYTTAKIERVRGQIRALKAKESALRAKLLRASERVRALKQERHGLRARRTTLRDALKASSSHLRALHIELTDAETKRYTEEGTCAVTESQHRTNQQARALESGTMRELSSQIRSDKPIATPEQITAIAAREALAASAAADATAAEVARAAARAAARTTIADADANAATETVKKHHRRHHRRHHKGKRGVKKHGKRGGKKHHRKHHSKKAAERAAKRAAAKKRREERRRKREAARARAKAAAEAKAKAEAEAADAKATAADTRADAKVRKAEERAKRHAARAAKEARNAKRAAKKAAKKAAKAKRAAEKAKRERDHKKRREQRERAEKARRAAEEAERKATRAQQKAEDAAKRAAEEAERAAKEAEQAAKQLREHEERDAREAERDASGFVKNHKCSDLGVPHCKFASGKRPHAPAWCRTHGRRCALDCFGNGTWQWTARTHCRARGKKCRGTCCIGGWNWEVPRKGGGAEKCVRRIWPRTKPATDMSGVLAAANGASPAFVEADTEADAEADVEAEADAEAQAEMDADEEAEAPSTCRSPGVDAESGVEYGPCMRADETVVEVSP